MNCLRTEKCLLRSFGTIQCIIPKDLNRHLKVSRGVYSRGSPVWHLGAYETKTTTATRTSFKNTSSRYSYHYETISCRFALKMCCNCRGIKLVCLGWKRRERTENSSPCANVLQRTLNLVISRRHLGADDKELYQKVKRTCRSCRAIVFAHKTNKGD